MKKYIDDHFEEAKQLVRELCAIPSPSYHEEKKAVFVKKWFEQNGGKDVFIDGVNNVVCPYNLTEENRIIVFTAHTDTVFPDLEPMPFKEHDGKMFCPGVLDDTANLVSLMYAAKYIMENKIPLKYGILFVADTCEEGLGNSRGCRMIVQSFGDRIKHLIAVDGTSFGKIINKAVGSHRYEVTVKTEGGHSFRMFGKPNAIAQISSIISDLYDVDVPVSGNSTTTYNVGTICGGTSVNTIASEATMLYEYRSDNVECLEQMKEIFQGIIQKHGEKGADIRVKLIGERPCGNLDTENPEFRSFTEEIKTEISSVLGKVPSELSGSTDSNIALANSIISVCLAAAEGSGCHTRDEYLEVDSMKNGIEILVNLIIHKYGL